MQDSYSTGRRWLKPALFAFAGLIAVGLIVYFVVVRSVPGDTLYSMKVNYVEEGIEAFLRFTPELEASYHVTLLERRFGELQTLAARENIDEGDVWYLYDETVERANELVAHLAAEDGGGMTHEKALMFNHDMVTVLRAMEVMTEEDDRLAFLEENIEDERRETENMFDDRVEQFIARASDERVKQFISDQLGEVLGLIESRRLERRLEGRVEDHIDEAKREIIEGNGDDAIVEIADALRLIEVADYFGQAEAEVSAEVEQTDDETQPTEEAEPPATGTQRIETDGAIIEVKGLPEGVELDPETFDQITQ